VVLEERAGGCRLATIMIVITMAAVQEEEELDLLASSARCYHDLFWCS